MDPLVVSSFAAMAAAGWNCAQATGYRRKKAGLDARSRELAAETARIEAEIRAPRLFPPSLYQLTRTMLSYAVRGELDDLAALIRAEHQETCQLVLDQCVAVADCIVNGRSAAWPPSDDDLRIIAAITTSSMEAPENNEGRAKPPATIADSVVYDYLSRAVVRGEFVEKVFPVGEAAVLAVRITAAMLVAFLPGRPWQGHLELIWKLESKSGVNWPAFRAAECLVRRKPATTRPADDNGLLAGPGNDHRRQVGEVSRKALCACLPGAAKSVHQGHLAGRLARHLDQARAGHDDRHGLLP